MKMSKTGIVFRKQPARAFCCWWLLLAANIVFAGPGSLKRNFAVNTRDSFRVLQLLKDAGLYYDTEWNYTNKAKVDSALPLLREAWWLADSLQLPVLKHECFIARGKYYFRCDNWEQAGLCFQSAIALDSALGNKKLEASAWFKFADRTPLLGSLIPLKEERYVRALHLYESLNNSEKQIEIYQRLADILLFSGRTAEARKKLLWLLALQKKKGATAIADTYRLLANAESFDGNYNFAINNGLLALAQEGPGLDPYTASELNGSLGGWYLVLGETDNALHYLLAALRCFREGSAPDVHQCFRIYEVLRQIVHCMVLQGKVKEALIFFDSSNAKLYPETDYARQCMAGAKGDCYKALKDYRTAESFYLLAVKIALHNNRLSNTQQEYFQIADLYSKWGKFELADQYLNRFMFSRTEALNVSRLRDVEYMRFRADSAKGKYLFAITHYIAYKRLHDSIFSTLKTKQIQELQMQYGVVQKEHSIALLKQNEIRQDARYQKAMMERKAVLFGLVLLMLILVIVYIDAKKKKRLNAVLYRQQQMIFTKNASLQNLINEKERLLEEKSSLVREKESLLIEVHHRVKNSLQLVNSLLYSQSMRLKDEESVKVFNDSRHRIQSVSLLHQKLYMSDSLQFVNVQSYIEELVLYLNDGYNKDGRVRFQVKLDEVSLSIQQAIPIGLIITEAVTNAIKYAFPLQADGVIRIVFTNKGPAYELVIQDNGIGFEKDFSLPDADSLGMTLIRGFCDQLEADIEIQSKNGVSISIVFCKEVEEPASHNILK